MRWLVRLLAFLQPVLFGAFTLAGQSYMLSDHDPAWGAALAWLSGAIYAGIGAFLVLLFRYRRRFPPRWASTGGDRAVAAAIMFGLATAWIVFVVGHHPAYTDFNGSTAFQFASLMAGQLAGIAGIIFLTRRARQRMARPAGPIAL